MAGYQQLHSTRPDERFCQNIFWVNCFFHQFLIFVEKIVKSWKKKLVRVVIRFFFVSRGTISGKNYFLEKFTLIHPSDLDCKKKFNCRRKSFTIDAAGSFYVFRGNFSGKQVVLEKHKNFHQFWILKQNSIETSQKNLKTMSTLTFSCRVERSSRKKFFTVFKTFRFFWIVAGFWRRKIENFCKNAMAGLTKLHFTCREERFPGKQFFWENCSLFNFWLSRRRLWLLQKILVRVA